MTDSLKVFGIASLVSSSQIIEVYKVSSANSVWITENEDGAKLVLKFFANDDHSRAHFEAEICFLEANRQKGFLPKVLWKSDSERAFAMEYVDDNESKLCDFDSALEILLADFPSLSIPVEVHAEPPGILSWGSNDSEVKSPVQKLILETMRTTDWFRVWSREARESWSRHTVTHGDLKLANVRFGSNGPVILDWENVSLGPPSWDIAGLVQAIMVEVLQDGPKRDWARQNLRRAMAYLSSSEREIQQLAALRAVQSAFEMSSTDLMFQPAAANILQCADFIAKSEFQRVLQELQHA